MQRLELFCMFGFIDLINLYFCKVQIPKTAPVETFFNRTVARTQNTYPFYKKKLQVCTLSVAIIYFNIHTNVPIILC